MDILLIGHGTLSDQELAKTDFDIARLEIESNYLSFVSLLTKFLPKFKNQAFGSIGVITSVPGIGVENQTMFADHLKRVPPPLLMGLERNVPNSALCYNHKAGYC